MKFTVKQLREIESFLDHAIAEHYAGPPASVSRLLDFIQAEISDVTQSEPDTIEMYFANGHKMPGVGRPNPFVRAHQQDIKTAGGVL